MLQMRINVLKYGSCLLCHQLRTIRMFTSTTVLFEDGTTEKKKTSKKIKQKRKYKSNRVKYINISIQKLRDIQAFKAMTAGVFGPKWRKSKVRNYLDNKIKETKSDINVDNEMVKLRDGVDVDKLFHNATGNDIYIRTNKANIYRRVTDNFEFGLPRVKETNIQDILKRDNEVEFGAQIKNSDMNKKHKTKSKSKNLGRVKVKNKSETNASEGTGSKEELEKTNSVNNSSNREDLLKVTKNKAVKELSRQLQNIREYPLTGEHLPLPDDYGLIKPVQEYISSGLRKPSVTAILNETMSPQSKANLERWKKQKIAELGLDGFEEYQKKLFFTGSNFHECVAAQLEQKSDIDVLPENDGVWESIQHTFNHISDVDLIETKVEHYHLGYRGILDSVLKYRGQLVLVDWKTSDRRKDTLDAAYDDPLQIMAYIGALNSDPNINFQVKQGILVVAYRDGHPADVLPMKPIVAWMYWNQWLARLQMYWTNKLSGNQT